MNRADGDFSTTFLTLLYHLSLRNGNDDYDLATHMLGFAASGDWHLPGVFGAFSDEQRELYGSWRVRLQAEGMRVHGATCVDSAPGSLAGRVRCALRGRSRLALEGELAPRHPGALSRRLDPAVKPYRISAELSHTFDALLRTGVFVKLHDGQDYYNIGFVNRRRVMTVGLVLDASGADRIGKTIVAP